MIQKIKNLTIPIFITLIAIALRIVYGKGKRDQKNEIMINDLKYEYEINKKTIKVISDSINMSDERITSELLQNFSSDNKRL